jgi:hypothetical protein
MGMVAIRPRHTVVPIGLAAGAMVHRSRARSRMGRLVLFGWRAASALVKPIPTLVGC